MIIKQLIYSLLQIQSLFNIFFLISQMVRFNHQLTIIYYQLYQLIHQMNSKIQEEERKKRFYQVFLFRELESKIITCKFSPYGLSTLGVPAFHRKNLELIGKTTPSIDFQYIGFSGRQSLKTAFIQHFPEVKYFNQSGIKLTQKNLLTTLGAVKGIKHSIEMLCDDGDEFILFQPIYPCYIPKKYIDGKIKLKRVLNIFSQEANQYKFDFEELDRSITPKTKVIAITNPNNPTSRSINKQEFLEFGKLLKKHPQLTLIEDRAYFCYYSLKTRPLLFAQINPDLFSRSITVYSMGKLFDITGLRCGMLIASEQFLQKFIQILTMNFQMVSTAQQIVCQKDIIDAVELDQNGNNFYERVRIDVENRALRAIHELKAKYDIDCTAYEGTYYITMKIEKLRGKIQQEYFYEDGDKTKQKTSRLDLMFCRKLFKLKQVGAIPYSEMTSGKIDNMVRISINRNDQQLQLFLSSLEVMIN